MADPVIQIGSTNARAVEEAQFYLMSYGYLAANAVLGTFGPAMQGAVQAFQRNNGLGVDGVIGPNTWAMLRSPNPVKADGTRVTYQPQVQVANDSVGPGPSTRVDFEEGSVIYGRASWWGGLSPVAKAAVASLGLGVGLLVIMGGGSKR